MKLLGLANASASAQRFRLTFDETADAGANTVLELPVDVNPQALGSKRPSCICGEPELPGEFRSAFQESDSSSCFKSDQWPLINKAGGGPVGRESQPLLSSISQGKMPSSSLSNTHIPNGEIHNDRDIMNSVPTLYTSQYAEMDDEISCELIKVDDVDAMKNEHQNQMNGFGHPKITIRISNSQQSFSPFLCDSPVEGTEFGNEHYISQHEHDTRDLTPSPYPEGSYLYHSQSALSGYFSAIPGSTEEGHLLSHQNEFHQDQVQAPPIQDMYRYHVFFSHSSEDREWVEHMVAHLEAPPFNYTCAYASIQDEADQSTLQQRILCAAMLSERVVLVLSTCYVQETWFSFEKTLKQLTQMSLHNQRIMGVLLEDCHIPDSLGELYFLDSSDPDFFHVFTKRLKTSKITILFIQIIMVFPVLFIFFIYLIY